MILPDKTLTLSNSLLGSGFIILSLLHQPSSISALWEKGKKTSSITSFEKFVLALDLLKTLGLVEIRNNLLYKYDKVS